MKMKMVSAQELINQIWLEKPLPEDISEYLSNIRNIINIKVISSVYWNDLIENKEYHIKSTDNISKDCVLDIIETIEYQYVFNKVLSIFLEQIETEKEKEIFENFLYDFNEFTVDELISRDYISWLDKDSITIKLIQMIYNWYDFTFSMIKILKELWINIKSSDFIDNDLWLKIETHIRDIQKSLIELVIWNNYSYTEEHYEVRKIH
jgi:hypothetical protein